MKICFAIGTLSYSGAEKIMYYLMKDLVERNHEVSVILISCDKLYDGLDRIKQYPIYDKEEEASANRFIRVVKRQQRIRKVILKNSFDLVVSFGVKFNLDVAESCIGTKTRLVLCERNDPVYDPASRLLRLRRAWTYNRGNGFVFQTREIQSFFSKRIQRRSAVIPNFLEEKVQLDRFERGVRNSFATCARLDNNQKNQIGLIDAFYEFHKEYTGYGLEFFGDGPDRGLYEGYVKQLDLEKYVIFHGRVENPMHEIVKCKFFVLSSKYEGMPNALIEAMAYSMPCISVDCGGGGAKALIENGENGILVPYGNKEELKNAMKKVVEDTDFSNMIAANAYRINETLDKKGIVAQWEEFFVSVLK